MKKLLLPIIFVILSTTAFAAQQPTTETRLSEAKRKQAKALFDQAKAAMQARYKQMTESENEDLATTKDERRVRAKKEEFLCAICKRQISENELQTLPCNSINPSAQDHSFHRECIGPWLKLRNDCPTCRTRQNPEGLSIHEAAANGNKSSIQYLIILAIANDKPINQRRYDGATPLLLAITNDHIDILQMLIEALIKQNPKATINPKIENDSNDITLLHVAAKAGQAAIVKTLIEWLIAQNPRADITPTKKNGDTPLHLAAEYGKIDVVKVYIDALIKRDGEYANLNPARQTDATTPLFLAANNGHTDIVKLLIEALLKQDPQMNINPATKPAKTTPLHIAAMFNHLPVVKIIVEALLQQKTSANINPTKLNGGTPLSISKELNNTEVAEYLEAKLREQAEQIMPVDK